MKLRAARGDDAGAIAALTNTIIRDTLITFTTVERTTDSIVADVAARGARFLVAEDAGAVTGFATYGPFRGGPGYAYCCELTIQLRPEARGQGVGRALLQALEDVARADGMHVMVAGISSANPEAIAFHQAVGFRQVGRMPEVGFKMGQWLDLILMQKVLSQVASPPPDTDRQTR